MGFAGGLSCRVNQQLWCNVNVMLYFHMFVHINTDVKYGEVPYIVLRVPVVPCSFRVRNCNYLEFRVFCHTFTCQ